ncbi:hypothetical protein AB0J86_28755 [Micromonospora sp. NPDC049559]|uniref:hypothetical protein n=1 Tax=Micromonospora sp. NPDC049559 TaxID=3155923 RepID=UPI003426B511
MSKRPCLRTGALIVGGMLMLALSACGGGSEPARWDAGASPSASAQPSVTTEAPTPTPSAAATTATPTRSPSSPPKKTEKPPATGGVRVTVARGGGVAGVSQTLTVEADGRWSYQDRKAGKSQSGTLGTSQRAQLQGLLTSPALAKERGVQGGCSDGFTYALTTSSTLIFWRACGHGEPKTASAVVRLLEGATAF